jgi:hypothetical protein
MGSAYDSHIQVKIVGTSDENDEKHPCKKNNRG